MEKINILYIGRNQEILDTVVRLLNKREEWNGIGVKTDEEAKAVFRNTAFDVVLLGSGLDEESEQSLCTFFGQHRPGVKVLQHYGGGSGLLYSEIAQALALK